MIRKSVQRFFRKRSCTIKNMEHDPEKCVAVFRKRSCSIKNLERDGDSTQSHRASNERTSRLIEHDLSGSGCGITAACRSLLRERRASHKRMARHRWARDGERVRRAPG